VPLPVGQPAPKGAEDQAGGGGKEGPEAHLGHGKPSHLDEVGDHERPPHHHGQVPGEDHRQVAAVGPIPPSRLEGLLRGWGGGERGFRLGPEEEDGEEAQAHAQKKDGLVAGGRGEAVGHGPAQEVAQGAHEAQEGVAQAEVPPPPLLGYQIRHPGEPDHPHRGRQELGEAGEEEEGGDPVGLGQKGGQDGGEEEGPGQEVQAHRQGLSASPKEEGQRGEKLGQKGKPPQDG
jgi:hypothetical protein